MLYLIQNRVQERGPKHDAAASRQNGPPHLTGQPAKRRRDETKKKKQDRGSGKKDSKKQRIS